MGCNHPGISVFSWPIRLPMKPVSPEFAGMKGHTMYKTVLAISLSFSTVAGLFCVMTRVAGATSYSDSRNTPEDGLYTFTTRPPQIAAAPFPDFATRSVSAPEGKRPADNLIASN
jgi:hypothetical protein